MAHVRPYQTSDENNVVNIFRETAHVNIRSHPDPETLRYGEYLWCRAYIQLRPDWCFVLDDGTGKAVGYILCAPDTLAFAQQWEAEFFPVLKENGVLEPDRTSESQSDIPVRIRYECYHPGTLLHPEYPSLAEEYPAHLHINISSSHRNQGWGQKLITSLFQRLLTENIAGIFLGMSADNEGAGRFYERLGFERYREMNDKGEPGRDGDGVYWVRKFQRNQPM